MKTVRLFVLAICFSAFSAHAATYIVPPDELLIGEATAIVTGTITTATPRLNSRGAIETVFAIAVDEVLKGSIDVQNIQLVEWGGKIGRRSMGVVGGPRYAVRQRYLIFMVRNRDGAWTTQHLTLGRFEFVPASDGELLLRDAAEIIGWDMNRVPAVEPKRNATKFVRFIRNYVRGTDVERDYFLDAPLSTIAESPREQRQITPNFAGYDIADASVVGVNAWTADTGSDVNYGISATPASNATLNVLDGEEKIIEEDPENEIAGSFGGFGVVATAFWAGGDNHSFESQEYITITGSDIVTQDGVAASSIGQSVFRTVMVHEVGHTLGFRHSNENTQGGACTAPLPCTSSAVMNASVTALDGVLQSWDVDAVRATYGSGGTASDYTTKFCTDFPACTTFTAETGRRVDTNVAFRLAQVGCTPPSIATQPQNKNISLGSSTNLTVSANGTAPLTYQWFIGSPPSTTVPTGTNSPSITVSPIVDTTYWVRITNSCEGGSVDSNAATVTVTCTAPTIATQPGGGTITEGQSIQLQVIALGTGLSYQWFVGNSGDPSQPIGTNNFRLTVTPAQTTSFWVRVSGACGSPVDSNTVTVNVVPCADLTVDAPTATANPGIGNYRLNVNAFSSSTPLLFQWFRGNTPGLGGTPIGATQAVNVTVTAVTSFWARVTNGCGKSEVTELITVAPCTLPVITTQPADQTIANGASANLSIRSNDPAATVKWYRGEIGDRTTQVGAAQDVTVGPLTQTTKFWAEVTNACGPVSSRLVTVTVEQSSTKPGLLAGRFSVEVRYRNQFANPPTEGLLTGQSLLSSALSETVIFWFDSPLIVELMVRISDARPFDNHYHVYYGGLSDVEFFINVRDNVTGKTVEYHKLPNQLIGQLDRSSFATTSSLRDGIDALRAQAWTPMITPNADTSTLLMLNRYQVRMRYRNQFANPISTGFLLGRSIAKAPTTDTAVFYFENPESVEWLVRFSDVRPFANRIDFFHGGLSDVEFTVEVTDTQTGLQREYPVAPFSLAGGVDRSSFVP